MHGDPYDKNSKTIHACVAVICKHVVCDDMYDDNNNTKCGSPCSDMPRIHVTRITIHDMTVFREVVPLYVSVGYEQNNNVTCHRICATCTCDHSVQCDRLCKSWCSECMHTTV